MTTSTEFELECQTLGLACAKANFRLDKKVPLAFKSAFLGYRSQKKKLNYFERKWLSLRLSAVKRGMVLDPQVDAVFLERITPSRPLKYLKVKSVGFQPHRIIRGSPFF